ncbi:uncharacterized protein LOC113234593 [Hyposmocoma kahamanoa]|uniref:uncharacterized protein LOC113234593 n=1 Tax=Hyposmocoma kahamanoa TaxID=1477025 RepID=UPI000E6D9B11|nr:uncharacterized protein LOC113234593 [Hyposmocoma kahamanoa]
MLKLTAVVSLMLVAIWSHADSKRIKKEATPSADFDPGSTLWAASLSCDSCGSECAAACGTRHFRSCCFNYLRRKRGDESIRFWPQPLHITDRNLEPHHRPIFVISDIPEPWPNVVEDYKPHPLEDTAENRLQILYDA